MKATLTKTTPVQNSRRAKPSRSLVYVNSPFDDIVDEFGSRHKIWNLDFKSKTWSAVCREATKYNIKALKTIFPEAVSIKFSAKAGCSCGCSPGYIVKTNSTSLGTNNWADIEASQVVKDMFRLSIFSARRKFELHEEINNHKMVATH
jgi:hypothetical protein